MIRPTNAKDSKIYPLLRGNINAKLNSDFVFTVLKIETLLGDTKRKHLYKECFLASHAS